MFNYLSIMFKQNLLLNFTASHIDPLKCQFVTLSGLGIFFDLKEKNIFL